MAMQPSYAITQRWNPLHSFSKSYFRARFPLLDSVRIPHRWHSNAA